MDFSSLDYLAAGAGALAAGAVNALAGGGTLISFPILVALGVPAVNANVTNTVSLLPGYMAGTWTQREDLRPHLAWARVLLGVAAAGGLAGSILLVTIPAQAFRVAVPYLILLSCALLLFQDRLRTLVADPDDPDHHGGGHRFALPALVFLAAGYGGFFGAGLGIMMLAILGMFSAEPLAKLNALKQALSFVINLLAAGFFAFSNHVVWELVPVMAAASILGALGGARLVRVIDSGVLRRLVVVAGVGVAVAFWVG